MTDIADARPDAAARPAHLGFQLHRFWAIGLLLAMTLGLLSVIQAPMDQWYLSYVCLVPWLIVVGTTATARRVYVTSWLLGAAFFLINMWWMEPATRTGYIALSLYLAFYFPLTAWPLRHAVRRRGLPLSVAMPIVWVGAEYVRSLGPLGFPWFYLAHSHYKITTMIQVSDLFGAYGLSFVIAAVNGAVADVIMSRLGGDRRAPARVRQARRVALGCALTLALVLATFGYGRWRNTDATISPGPRIAILQRNYLNSTNLDEVRNQPGPGEKSKAYFEMLKEAEPQAPDLYLFPETAWTGMYLNREFLQADEDLLKFDFFKRAQRASRRYDKMVRNWSERTGASVVIGSASLTPTPLSLRAAEQMHNSAFHYQPGRDEVQRHDKTHPVLFGEAVPFRFGRLRFLYLWLNGLSPFGAGGFEYSLTAGERVVIFDMTTAGENGKSYRFGTPICYEDVMPYVCRRFVWDREKSVKRVDFLLNISNDGWFQHLSELPQHFAICTFRAVENRVGIARSVNTGVSGFIDPNGRAYEKMGVGEVGVRVAPVMTDSRVSLYSRTGNVFALCCALAWGLLCIDYIVVRSRSGGAIEGTT